MHTGLDPKSIGSGNGGKRGHSKDCSAEEAASRSSLGSPRKSLLLQFQD